jgi:16S rRNA (adenine1518-N6/adenine1519-N6)-dimethyltransferase
MNRPFVRPKKGLGQNFLTDPQAVTDVIEAADLTGRETVVEVGPGTGLLTEPLAARAAQVIAIELDEELIPELEEKFGTDPKVEVHHGDILALDPTALPEEYVVVANVPYYITSKIIRYFLEAPRQPRAMTMTIQQEVAERITATPPKISVLAVSVQLHGTPRIAARIPRTAFWPAPDVDSAVLRVEDIGQAEANLQGLPEAIFFKVVRAGFAEKRKQLHNSLSRNLALPPEETTALLESVSIEPTRRAETLTIDDWVRLATAYDTR